MSPRVLIAAPSSQVFADNAEILDEMVTDETVSRFVELIRGAGREARFVEFLIVLCQCNGKAVRPNQWRVCKLLLQEAPELLFRLQLRSREDSIGLGGVKQEGGTDVFISGDPRYFPAFRDEGEMELSRWLDVTAPTNVTYFEHSMELIALLVRGRNLKNVVAVQKMLPYELVEVRIA